MDVSLQKSLFEGAVGAVIGVTAGVVAGASGTITATVGGIIAVTMAIKNIALQILEKQYHNAYDPKGCTMRLIIAAASPTALAIGHFVLNLFPSFVVTASMLYLTLEALEILRKSRTVNA